MDKKVPHPLFKLATELGPLLIFFFANAKTNLFIATGVFMVAVLAAMVASYVVTRHVPMMAIVTAVALICVAMVVVDLPWVMDVDDGPEWRAKLAMGSVTSSCDGARIC